MPLLIVECDTPETCPINFLGDTSELVYFMSFAHAERYGSAHELAKAAASLKRQLHINMAPLLNFGDARAENAEAERALATLWQEPMPLAECCREVAEAISTDATLQHLTADYPDLLACLRQLADMAQWAAERSAKVRLTYLL